MCKQLPWDTISALIFYLCILSLELFDEKKNGVFSTNWTGSGFLYFIGSVLGK
jgi:hypothetical protein